MNKILSYTDSLAIGLSALCVVHCLAMPILLVILPSLTMFQLDNEAFHSYLLIGVIPSSLFSLIVGCKQHSFYRVLLIGFFGLALLISAVFIQGFEYAELLEKVLTVLGACVIAIGHFLNFRLCRDHRNCECHPS